MNTKDTLILSGGSLKGIAHVGVLKALKDKDLLKTIKTVETGKSDLTVLTALVV